MLTCRRALKGKLILMRSHLLPVICNLKFILSTARHVVVGSSNSLVTQLSTTGSYHYSYLDLRLTAYFSMISGTLY